MIGEIEETGALLKKGEEFEILISQRDMHEMSIQDLNRANAGFFQLKNIATSSGWEVIDRFDSMSQNFIIEFRPPTGIL